nr:hypothetical protein [uncultured Arsenicibacter sp.]
MVHGEYASMEAFQQALTEAGYANVTIPKKGDSFDL